MIFCYLNDNASIDVLRRSFLLLRLPILRVHKFPPFGFRSCSARLSYMRFSRCVGTCVSLPFRPSTVEHFFFCSGGHLLSHAVSSIVPSAVQVLTVVFGMGTGVSPARIAARSSSHHLITQQRDTFLYFFFLRKEVIQPHLPIRLPCYDFTPVIGPTLGSSLLAVGSLTSGVADSHGVTGGVYKTRERIHRSMLICDY